MVQGFWYAVYRSGLCGSNLKATCEPIWFARVATSPNGRGLKRAVCNQDQGCGRQVGEQPGTRPLLSLFPPALVCGINEGFAPRCYPGAPPLAYLQERLPSARRSSSASVSLIPWSFLFSSSSCRFLSLNTCPLLRPSNRRVCSRRSRAVVKVSVKKKFQSSRLSVMIGGAY